MFFFQSIKCVSCNLRILSLFVIWAQFLWIFCPLGRLITTQFEILHGVTAIILTYHPHHAKLQVLLITICQYIPKCISLWHYNYKSVIFLSHVTLLYALMWRDPFTDSYHPNQTNLTDWWTKKLTSPMLLLSMACCSVKEIMTYITMCTFIHRLVEVKTVI